jgi:hypothetical protein
VAYFYELKKTGDFMAKFLLNSSAGRLGMYSKRPKIKCIKRDEIIGYLGNFIVLDIK